MHIVIFGKKDCNLCEAAKKKVNFLLNKWGVAGQVEVKFIDVDTVEGRVESAYRDVGKVPTTVAFNNGENETGRWVTDPPDTEGLRRALGLDT